MWSPIDGYKTILIPPARYNHIGHPYFPDWNNPDKKFVHSHTSILVCACQCKMHLSYRHVIHDVTIAAIHVFRWGPRPGHDPIRRSRGTSRHQGFTKSDGGDRICGSRDMSLYLFRLMQGYFDGSSALVTILHCDNIIVCS